MGRTLGWNETVDFCHCMKYHMACQALLLVLGFLSVTVKIRVCEASRAMGC